MSAEGVVSVAAGSRRAGFAGDGGPATKARLRSPKAIAALPSGGFIFVDEENHRIRLVDASGTIRTVVGGGRRGRWRDGAAGRSVASGVATDLEPLRDGSVLIARAGSVWRLGPDGQLHVVMREGARSPVEVPDGFRRRAVELDALADDVIAVLGEREARSYVVAPGSQLGVMAPLERIDRLAVALTASSRTMIRRGSVDIVATHPASARVEVHRGARVVASADAQLVHGLNHVAIVVPRDPARHTLRVTATDAAGRIAIHGLSFVAEHSLTRGVMRETLYIVEALVSDVGYGISHGSCHRTSRTAFRCRRYEHDGDGGDMRRVGTATIRLTRAGLVRYTTRDRRGRLGYSTTAEPGA